MKHKFKLHQFVVDRWWAWRLGRIERVGKTRIRVRWVNNGEVWCYDLAHMKFLRLSRPV